MTQVDLNLLSYEECLALALKIRDRLKILIDQSTPSDLEEIYDLIDLGEQVVARLRTLRGKVSKLN